MSTAKPADARHPPAPPAEALLHHVVSSRGPTDDGVTVPTDGDYAVTIAYLDGSATGRQADVSANGGAPQTITFTPTGSFNTVGMTTITLALQAGANTIEFGNPDAFAPDFDRIFVAATPS